MQTFYEKENAYISIIFTYFSQVKNSRVNIKIYLCPPEVSLKLITVNEIYNSCMENPLKTALRK